MTEISWRANIHTVNHSLQHLAFLALHTIVIFESVNASLICSTSLRTSGAADPSSLDAFATPPLRRPPMTLPVSCYDKRLCWEYMLTPDTSLHFLVAVSYYSTNGQYPIGTRETLSNYVQGHCNGLDLCMYLTIVIFDDSQLYYVIMLSCVFGNEDSTSIYWLLVSQANPMRDRPVHYYIVWVKMPKIPLPLLISLRMTWNHTQQSWLNLMPFSRLRNTILLREPGLIGVVKVRGSLLSNLSPVCMVWQRIATLELWKKKWSEIESS